MNIGAIVATTAGGCVVVGYLLRAVHAIYKWCQKLGDAIEKVQDRSAQLEPNGGSSMRDAVNRIEAHLKKQDELIAELQDTSRPVRRGRRFG